MSTLYVSDLDGTLLRNNQRTSEYTNNVINKIVNQGIYFTYATARSYITAAQVTKGLTAEIPTIVYTGAFIRNNRAGTYLHQNFFKQEFAYEIIDELLSKSIYPIVYSVINGEEKFTYSLNHSGEGVIEFSLSKKGDPRQRGVNETHKLYDGDIFYIVCIDDEQRLYPESEKYKDICHTVYQKDYYSKRQWLEIMPKESSKANAAIWLKEKLCCDKIVSFGDSRNDIDLFKISDECYAVGNAVSELKGIATGVILSNEEDGVAKFLAEKIL